MQDFNAGDFPLTCLNIRDYFAVRVPKTLFISMSAAQAAKLLGIKEKEYNIIKHYPIIVAKQSYDYADAMLEEKQKRDSFNKNNDIGEK